MSRRRRKQPGGLAGGDVLTWGLLLGVGGFAAYQVVEELKERAAVKAPATTTPTTTTPATTTPTTTTTAPATGTVVGGSVGAAPATGLPSTAPAVQLPRVDGTTAANTAVLGMFDKIRGLQASGQLPVVGQVPAIFPFPRDWIAKPGGPSTQPVVYEQ